ncbi:MAG: DMT family transporter [candidate division Zixibacteria bacterium]|nr:DMT family transporter [candidate division Zixibacteria bacterium]
MVGLETYLGEALALSSAVIWAFAVILFKKSGEVVHPIGLNFFKGALAIILIIPTTWLFGETLLRDVPASEYWLLLASGALGIGVADTLFFKSLNVLGAGRSAIIDCMYSPSIISLSIIFLGESLTVLQIIGTTLIVSAVLSIIVEKHETITDRRHLLFGVTWGVLAMITMAVGIVMIKPLLNNSPLLWATEVRLVGGLIILMIVWMVHPARRAIAASIIAPQRWVYTVSGSFLGAYLSMIVWLGGMKYTQASTAAALSQTSNIFIFIFAALFLKEKITSIRMVAIGLGVIGAVFVIFG